MNEPTIIKTITGRSGSDLKLLLVENKEDLPIDNDYELTYDIQLESPSLKHCPVLVSLLSLAAAEQRLDDIVFDMFGV